MLTDQLVEFWPLNNSRVGAITGLEMVASDGIERYVNPAKIGAGWNTFSSKTLAVPSTQSLDPDGQAVSLSGWFRRRTAAGTGIKYLAMFRRNANVNNRLSLHCAGFGSGWNVTAQAVNVSFGQATALTPNTTDWFHVAVAWPLGQPIRLWINGVLTTGTNCPAATWGADFPEPSFVILGQASTGIDTDHDAIGLWIGRAIEQADVDQLYAGGAGWEYSAADNTPDSFVFTDQIGAARNVQVQSDVETIAGMDAGTAISVSGGEYSIDGGAYTSSPGTINPNQTLRLRLTSSASYDTPVSATVTVGMYSTTWTVRTGLPSFQALLLAPAL